MNKLNAQTPALNMPASKKSFYVAEILMLKSIVILLVLTFFLLNEMQASNNEINSLKGDIQFKTMKISQPDLVSQE